MDIFQYRDDLIGDYSSYVKGFLEVQDTEVEQFITSRLDGGFLWPEPLVQLNPAFVQGPTIDELVDQKRLHATCREIFRRDKTVEHPLGKPRCVAISRSWTNCDSRLSSDLEMRP